MKKMLLLILAAFLLCGFAGHAMATGFADGDLIRVVYQTAYSGNVPTGGTYEYVSDLGAINSLVGLTSLTQEGSVIASTSYTGLQVAYFAADLNSGNYNYNMYIGSTSATQPTFAGNWGELDGVMQALVGNNFQANHGAVNDFSELESALVSYWNIMDAGGAQYGTFSQNISPSGIGEAKLAPLATGGSVVMSLYAYGYSGNGLVGPVIMNDGKTMEIETLVVGGNPVTEIGPMAAAPIPPSMLLLGTGFLGLIGFRRKSHKA